MEGLWKQVTSTSSSMYQAAGISGDVIIIMWVDTETDTQSLYWAGTADLPEELSSEYIWESQNDTSRTAGALMASTEETKTFTYRDCQLSFSTSVMGTTTLVKMEKVSNTPPDISAPKAVDTETSSPATPKPPTVPVPENSSFKIGETWNVDGQWELTINSVSATDKRNEYSDKSPGAVYLVDYTYKNLGYTTDSSEGLFIHIDDTIIDSTGKMGFSYPGDITDFPQETPIGATCVAQACIGVENPGDFILKVVLYDCNEQRQSADFEVNVK